MKNFRILKIEICEENTSLLFLSCNMKVYRIFSCYRVIGCITFYGLILSQQFYQMTETFPTCV